MKRFQKRMFIEKLQGRDRTGSLRKLFVKRLENVIRPLGKEKTPETSYREMNTNVRFAVEHSLLQIDSYGHHVYD